MHTGSYLYIDLYCTYACIIDILQLPGGICLRVFRSEQWKKIIKTVHRCFLAYLTLPVYWECSRAFRIASIRSVSSTDGRSTASPGSTRHTETQNTASKSNIIRARCQILSYLEEFQGGIHSTEPRHAARTRGVSRIGPRNTASTRSTSSSLTPKHEASYLGQLIHRPSRAHPRIIYTSFPPDDLDISKEIDPPIIDLILSV